MYDIIDQFYRERERERVINCIAFIENNLVLFPAEVDKFKTEFLHSISITVFDLAQAETLKHDGITAFPLVLNVSEELYYREKTKITTGLCNNIVGVQKKTKTKNELSHTHR